MVMPVTSAPLVDAMVRMGPPTPQPTSKHFLPGPSRSSAARRDSCAASEEAQSLPGRRGEKWKLCNDRLWNQAMAVSLLAITFQKQLTALNITIHRVLYSQHLEG